jgi:hypothetical protein
MVTSMEATTTLVFFGDEFLGMGVLLYGRYEGDTLARLDRSWQKN